jgi:TldD protein
VNVQIKDCLDKLDLQKIACDYCDVRIEDSTKTEIRYRNGELQACDTKPSLGCFLRVYAEGRWFYASVTALDRIEAELKSLCEQAKVMKKGAQPKDLFGKIKAFTEEIFHYEKNPIFKVEVSKKRELCEAYLGEFREEPLVREFQIYYADWYKAKYFKSSKGVRYAFDANLAGIYFFYTLKEGDDLFEDFFQRSSDKFENLKGLDALIRDNLAESKAFLKAKTVEAGTYRVLLASPVVGVFAHESFGHKSEADAMLGDENAVKEWAIGSKIASDCVSIVDDGTRLGSSGYCPFDDEGIPAQKTYLINKGILSGRLHSLTTAEAFGEAPTGNARAVNFESEPIVRMTSTYVEPGDAGLDELISQTGEGLFIKDWKHGSGLSLFTIAPRKCYWIRGGKLAEPVRVAVITGSVFETLAKVEACGREFKLESSVLGGCGKNDQFPLPVADGGPAMLVSAMQVS